MSAFVIANGKMGDNLAKKTHENESDLTFDIKPSNLNFDFNTFKSASPRIVLAKKNPNVAAREYEIMSGIRAEYPQIYPENKAIKVVGQSAKPNKKTTKIQKIMISLVLNERKKSGLDKARYPKPTLEITGKKPIQIR